jgi:hypothetical protein
VRVVFVGVAIYLIGIALVALVSPDTFFAKIGPFGARNDHYIRDGATFELALGIGAAIAVRRVHWRVPIVVILALQFLFHAINHLVDLGSANPEWLGPVDFIGLALGAGILGWTAWRLRDIEPER